MDEHEALLYRLAVACSGDGLALCGECLACLARERLSQLDRRFEAALEAFREAATHIEYERGDCHEWTRDEALSELREELAEADQKDAPIPKRTDEESSETSSPNASTSGPIRRR